MCFCYFAWRYHVHSFSGCLCLCATRTRTALSTTSQRRRRSAKHVLTSSWCRLNRVIHEISWAVHWKTRNGFFISQLHRHRMNTCFVTSQCIGCSLHCLRRLQRFPKPSTFQCQIPDWQESCILRSTNWLELALPVDPAVAKSASRSWVYLAVPAVLPALFSCIRMQMIQDDLIWFNDSKIIRAWSS